jgi:hypothetical protein
MREKEARGWLVATEAPCPKATRLNTKVMSSACGALLCAHQGTTFASLGGRSCYFDEANVALACIDVYPRHTETRCAMTKSWYDLDPTNKR